MRALSAITTTTVLLATAASFAVALPGCTSDQTQSPEGIGSVDMTVTLATPPSGPNEQIDTVNVSLFCEGIDPVLGVPRPAQSSPETFTINVSTSQGPEPYNTIGLFEKQGLPAGPCHFEFFAVSNTGNTECTGKLSVVINTDSTTPGEVVLACIHTPRYGGVRSDGSFNQCAEYRQILLSPTTQAIGNLVDVRTEVYDPDGDDVTVAVQTAGVCGNVATIGSDTAASCETVSGCEAVVNTVECTGVGLCEITVAVSDDGFSSCDGLLPDGSSNDAARSTIAVDCTATEGEPPVVCDYEQDFEALDPGASEALQSDGWLYFGNVFDGTGAFKFGFGPFPAPTTTGQISAIATGEGGPAQGNNQLVVFSNYDCCGPGTANEGHFNGTDLVETIVFQEINPILASDIGRTFTFEFDAKRGNIGGATTAQAFIRTLDPNAGFATTNNVVHDTTNLPANWATYSISLDLSDPALVGHDPAVRLLDGRQQLRRRRQLLRQHHRSVAPGGGGGGPGIELRPLPEIYTTGTAINYGPYRAGGPGTGEFPSDADTPRGPRPAADRRLQPDSPVRRRPGAREDPAARRGEFPRDAVPAGAISRRASRGPLPTTAIARSTTPRSQPPSNWPTPIPASSRSASATRPRSSRRSCR